jgi:hypothetical protein
MDTLRIEYTAARLRQLGCTEEQIGTHLYHLRFNAERSKRLKHRSEPRERPTFRLTRDQIDALMTKLKERQWAWVVWGKHKDDWVGHAILSVMGTPAPNMVTDLVRSVLTELSQRGLIKRVGMVEACPSGELRATRYVVHVVEQLPKRERIPRERLHVSEPAEERASAGKTGSGHLQPAAHAQAAV